METIVFYLLAASIVFTGVAVVAMRNPIHSALALVCNLIGVAAIFASLQAHFLATVQVIVYAGAIMVLVIFVIMLLNIKEEKPARERFLLLGGVVLAGFAFFVALSFVFLHQFQVTPELTDEITGSVANIGRVLFTKYVFPFEAASLLIMAAIVGSIMIAKTKRREVS